MYLFIYLFIFIRNEEDYINKRTKTGEKKETKEREKNQGKDERSFLHKYQGKTPNNRTLKTKSQSNWSSLATQFYYQRHKSQHPECMKTKYSCLQTCMHEHTYIE